MPTCAVIGCKNGSWKPEGKKVRYFSFPKSEKYYSEWQKVCNGGLAKHSRICSAHFSPDSYDDSFRNIPIQFYPTRARVLKSDAVPTENLDLKAIAATKNNLNGLGKTNICSLSMNGNQNLSNTVYVRVMNTLPIQIVKSVRPAFMQSAFVESAVQPVHKMNVAESPQDNSTVKSALTGNIAQSLQVLNLVQPAKDISNIQTSPIINLPSEVEAVKPIEAVKSTSQILNQNTLFPSTPILMQSTIQPFQVMDIAQPTKDVNSAQSAQLMNSANSLQEVEVIKHVEITNTGTLEPNVTSDISTVDCGSETIDVVFERKPSKCESYESNTNQNEYEELKPSIKEKFIQKLIANTSESSEYIKEMKPLNKTQPEEIIDDDLVLTENTIFDTFDLSTAERNYNTIPEITINDVNKFSDDQDSMPALLDQMDNSLSVPDIDEICRDLVESDSKSSMLTIRAEDMESILQELRSCKRNLEVARKQILALEDEVETVKTQNKFRLERNQEFFDSFERNRDLTADECYESLSDEHNRSAKCTSYCNMAQECANILSEQFVNMSVKEDKIDFNEDTRNLQADSLKENLNFLEDKEKVVEGVNKKSPYVAQINDSPVSTNTLFTTVTPPPYQPCIIVVNSPNCVPVSVANVSPFQCNICSMTFVDELAFAAHKLISHSKTIVCNICSFECDSAQQLKTHKKEHKRKKVKECFVCGELLPRANLKVHFRSHSNLCITCLKVFSTREECKRHKKCHAKDFLCELCGKVVTHKRNLLTHMSAHSPEPHISIFECDLCPSVYRVQSSLKRHKLWVHNNKQGSNTCNICGKIFNNPQSLQMHSKVHSSHRPYKCEKCGKTFKWSKNLSQHLKCHVPSNRSKCRIPCNVCGKSLASKSGLYGHMKTHSKDTSDRIICHECGITLIDIAALKRHMVSHTGLKPFNCKYCDKPFMSKLNKENHERSHTGERPFHCEVCEKQFSSKGHLQEHSVVHSNVRPFKCKYCDKAFRRKTHLSLHVRTHTGDKRHWCSVCNRSFIQKHDMKKHMVVHNRKGQYKYVLRVQQDAMEDNILSEGGTV